ncbi:PhnD/SsuA/transferrin family substrate-binding protein [Shewanella sp. NIFS-20-20]|nr:PhnD/SsuA/transferrin family substrate-binding protein [Shewanella sp. NIFS-20-20]MBV7314637.1 PhnD/SsuA/transferrin family substrate-binding protein [Shewanella sp. NIFS-20-20]
MAFADPGIIQARWQPTADWLTDQLQRPVQVVPLTPEQLEQAIAQTSIDFIIGNAMTTVAFKKDHGTSHLLTLVNNISDIPELAMGSAVISHQQHPIDDWSALAHQRIISSDPRAFGGFQIFAASLANQGMDAYRDVKQLEFVGFPQQKLLQQLVERRADVAILPACVLESAVRQGRIAPGLLQVQLVEPQHALPCEVSTPLYPGYALSKLGGTDHQLATAVVKALLAITPHNPAALMGQYQSWAAPVDDSSVFALRRQLAQWPFVTNWQRLLHSALPWVAAVLIILLLGYLHHVRVKRLVVKRTLALSNEVAKHQDTQERLLEQQQQFYRAQRVLLTGEMASGIAHELKQPLAGIRYLAQGCVYRLDEYQQALATPLSKIIEQVDRAQTTIHRLREFCQQSSHYQAHDLGQIIEDTLMLMQPDLRHCQIHWHRPSQPCWVYADASLLQQVLVNLLRNALDAMTHLATPQLWIECQSGDIDYQVVIRDLGCGLSESALARLFLPFETSKPHGLGLGMVICKRIIEEHDGQIVATHAQPGLRLHINLPRKA